MPSPFIVRGLTALALAWAASGCQASPTAVESPAAAPDATAAPSDATAAAPRLTSTELNLYAWSEYIPQDLLDAFAAEHGIRVNYDAFSSNEELLAKMQAGAAGYDVILPSDYMVTVMAKQGMLEPLDTSLLANFGNLDPQFVDRPYDPGNAYSVPYQWGTVGIAVDTAAVSTPVTAWADLWDPAFAQGLVMVDDEREVIGLTLMTLGHDRNSTDPAELEAAKARLAALKPNIRLFDSDSPKTALLAGEVKAGVVWNGEAALAHRENPAIAYVLPAEGCGIWFDNLAMPKDPPHKDAALAFIDFVLRPDMSMLITRDFPYSNPNAAGLAALAEAEPELYAAYMAYPATNPPAADLAKCQAIVDIGDALPLWDKLWTDVKSGE